tara:strand:+ start:12671 stop:12967 length:297 start_codon:yes stop_codon:yes gene_type:complete
MRKITIVSTKIDGKTELQSSASTWDDLKTEFTSAGISTDGMKAMEKDTKVTYDNGKAVLPTGDFVLFLTPSKVKSGSDRIEEHYNTLMAKLDAIIDAL